MGYSLVVVVHEQAKACGISVTCPAIEAEFGFRIAGVFHYVHAPLHVFAHEHEAFLHRKSVVGGRIEAVGHALLGVVLASVCGVEYVGQHEVQVGAQHVCLALHGFQFGQAVGRQRVGIGLVHRIDEFAEEVYVAGIGVVDKHRRVFNRFRYGAESIEILHPLLVVGQVVCKCISIGVQIRRVVVGHVVTQQLAHISVVGRWVIGRKLHIHGIKVEHYGFFRSRRDAVTSRSSRFAARCKRILIIARRQHECHERKRAKQVSCCLFHKSCRFSSLIRFV